MNDLALYEQFKDLNLMFPKLSLEKGIIGLWSVQGDLHFSASFSGCQIDDQYSIKMVIPENYSALLPKVHETTNRIPRDFHHYQDDSLCLGIPIAVRYKFQKDPTLVGFVCNCVIPYLYSFSYKTKFGKLPFGELSHGALGIFEYYKDLFDVQDHRRIIKLIQILAENNYQGHARCPCGSGKRIRACHGKLLLEIQKVQLPAEFRSDHDSIIKHLIEKAVY